MQSLLFSDSAGGEPYFLGNKYSLTGGKGVQISQRGYQFPRKKVLGSIFFLGKMYSGSTFFQGVLIFRYTGANASRFSSRSIKKFFDEKFDAFELNEFPSKRKKMKKEGKNLF